MSRLECSMSSERSEQEEQQLQEVIGQALEHTEQFLGLVRAEIVERVGRRRPVSVQFAVNMATVLSCLANYRQESEGMGALHGLMCEMLFEERVQLAVKVRLMNSLPELARYEIREGKFVVVRELERLMELVGRREEVYLFGCLQKEVAISGQGSEWWQLLRCVLLMVEGLLEEPMVIGHQQYFLRMVRVMSACVPYFNQIKITDGSLSLSVLFVEVLCQCLMVIQQVEQAQFRQGLVRQLVKSMGVDDMVWSVLAYNGVRHQNREILCPFCVRGEDLADKTAMVKFRSTLFKIISSIIGQLQVEDCKAMMDQQCQELLLNGILMGVDCFLIRVELQMKGQAIEYFKAVNELVSVLLQIYYQFISRNKANFRCLLKQSQKLQQLMLLVLLQFNEYQVYLFEREPWEFYRYISDVCGEQGEVSAKCKVRKILRFIVSVEPYIQRQLIGLSMYYLQKHTNDFGLSWRLLPNSSERQPLPVEACFMLAVIFAESVKRDERQIQFYRTMLQVDNVWKMSDLGLAMGLQLIGELGLEVFGKGVNSMDIFDFGLRSESGTMRLLTLKCIQRLSVSFYSQKQLNLMSQLLFEPGKSLHEKSDLNFHVRNEYYGQIWQVLKVMVMNHSGQIAVRKKAALLVSIKKYIIQQLMFYKTTESNSQTYFLEPFSFCNIFLISVEQHPLPPIILRALNQIAVLYKYLPTTSLKNQMLPFICKLLSVQNCAQEGFPSELLSLLECFYLHFEANYEPQLLTVFELYIVTLGKINRPKLSRKISSILIKFEGYLKNEVEAAQTQQIEQWLIYGLLVIINKYVLYFGADISQSRLISVMVLCLKTMNTFQSDYLRQRVRTTLFACGLYTKRFPVWVTMMEQVRSGGLINYEREAMLDTVEICFSSKLVGGGIQKYVYLFKILYYFMQGEGQFAVEERVGKSILEVFEVLAPKIATKVQFYERCVRVFDLFRVCKNKLYLYLMDYIQPEIRLFFVKLCAEGIIQKQNSEIKMYQQRQFEEKQNLCPGIRELNPFKKVFSECESQLFTDIIYIQRNLEPKVRLLDLRWQSCVSGSKRVKN